MSDAAALVERVVGALEPLEVELARAWWASSTDVSPQAEARRVDVDVRRRALLADASTFAEIAAARHNGNHDPLVGRQLDVLHDAFLVNQLPDDLRRRLAQAEASLDSQYNAFRAQIDGREVDDNEIATVLRSSRDGDEREAAWEGSKQVGAVVSDAVRALAHLRNDAAVSLGFRDHFEMALRTSELDEERLFATLDEVDQATAAPFAEWKSDVDATLIEVFGLHDAGDLRPWHYDDPFFQEPPITGSVDLDPIFAGRDIEALTVETYQGIGLDISELIARSDLYPRDRKSQHAFCIDIDRRGDVRVLCNIEANERWMGTMLHEFGHAVYDHRADPTLPWLLRGAAHPLSTEGIAMLFGRLSRDPQWFSEVVGLDAREIDALGPPLAAMQRAALLVFARWVLVMTNFERSLYADPDGDHDTGWWDLVERYQLLHRPDRVAADWASKIHLAVAPVYYQNYLYGELVASQLAATLRERAGGLVGRPDAGAFLVEEFFEPGASLRWDELVEQATGEPLTARHLAVELRSA